MSNVKKHLTHLETVGLIRLAKTHPELEFMFRHALIRDAAYKPLLREDRKKLHRQVAEAIEQTYPDQLDEMAAALGQHFAKAGEVEKAIDYLFRAGDRARGLYANEEAIKHFREALALLQNTLLDESRQDWRHEVATQLHEGLGDVLELIGQHDEANSAYEDALTQVPKRDLIWQARLHRKIGKTWEVQRQYESALQAYSRAETTLGQEPAESAREWWQEWVQIQLDKIWVYYWQAQWPEIAELADKSRPLLEQYGTPIQRSKFFMGLVLMAFRRDRYWISVETLANAQAALAASQDSGNQSDIALAQFAVGFCHLWRDELDAAEPQMQAALALSERIGAVVVQSRCLTYLTIIQRKHGEVEEARRYITASLAISSAGQMLEYIGTAKANLAWVAWRETKLAETEENGREALELWQQMPLTYPFRWTALWPLIAVALAQGQVSEAIEHTHALLEPTQQRLPDNLTNVLEQAIQEWEANQPETTRIYLEQALELAQKLGYL